MYSVLSSFKRVLWVTQDFPLINENNERISWYSFPSLYFKWLPLHLFNVSSQFSVFIFWHFRVSAQPLSGDWKNHLLFLKNSFCQKLDFFLLNLHWNIYVRHQEHWTAKTITKHRLKCFDFFSGKYQNYTDTDWLKMFREMPNFFSKFVEYKFCCFWKTAKFFSEWSNYEKFISQRKVWYIFQYKKF